jgi:hypothetical protein
MHDPMSLHKYMYANANPITNTDPTGLTSLGEMSTALSINGVLHGANGLNYALLLQMLVKTAIAIDFSFTMRALLTSLLTSNSEGVLLALARGTLSGTALLGICQSAMAVQILRSALATYGVNKSVEALLEAADNNNVLGVLEAITDITITIMSLYFACFDGDTLVATEDGFKRIDEIQVGDRVWSYNIESGEKKLKEVKQVFVSESNEILHLETTEGNIDATTNHPFYVKGKGWVAAGTLVVGDEVHTLDGDTGTVVGLKFEKLDKPIAVYNIEVEDFQSYFVGNGVLVHNDCKGGWEKNRKTPIGEQLAGEGQLRNLRHNKNIFGVDIEALLRKSPEQLDEMLKNGEITVRVWKALKKPFEGRVFIPK